MDSLAPATIKQYNSVYKQWWTFCEEKNYDPYKSTTNILLRFLKVRFDAGASYSTLSSTRSALNRILNIDLTQNIVSEFLKGTSKKRPSKPKYKRIWDTSTVLSLLESWNSDDSTLKQLTEKTAMLLALTTAHRVQTFSLINIKNIKKRNDSLEIEIPDCIKTSGPGRFQPLLILPRFEEKPNLCVASTAEKYLEKTSSIRESTKKLFISYTAPHKAVTKDTISRWLKNTLTEAGIDGSQFSGHSTRAASTSKAALNGVSIDEIRNTATWSEKSQTFAKFYNKPITPSKNLFALTILNS